MRLTNHYFENLNSVLLYSVMSKGDQIKTNLLNQIFHLQQASPEYPDLGALSYSESLFSERYNFNDLSQCMEISHLTVRPCKPNNLLQHLGLKIVVERFREHADVQMGEIIQHLEQMLNK